MHPATHRESSDGDGRPIPASPRRLNVIIAVSIALGAIPVVLMAVLVARYAVDLPFSDEWGLVRLLRRARTGELELLDFHRQHGVHRLFIPKYILYRIASQTDWNTRYESAANVLLGISICLVLTTRVAATARRLQSPLHALLIPVLCLFGASLMQFENWMWGWQIQIFLVVLMTLSTVFLLTATTLGIPRFALAAICTGVATFSFANGLLLWPLGLCAIVARRKDLVSHPKAFVFTWSAVSLVAFLAYFHGFSMPRGAQATAPSVPGILDLSAYFLAYLGAPFAWFKVRVAIVAGTIGLTAAVAVTARLVSTGRQTELPALSGLMLCLFGLGSAAMTTFGRSDFGTVQAITSRYITISNVFWIGLVLMLAALLQREMANRNETSHGWRNAAIGILLAVVTASLLSEVPGARGMEGFNRTLRVLRYKLLDGREDQQMTMLYPDLKWLRYFSGVARRNQLWAWRPDAPPEMFEVPEFLFGDDPNVRREVSGNP